MVVVLLEKLFFLLFIVVISVTAIVIVIDVLGYIVTVRALFNYVIVIQPGTVEFIISSAKHFLPSVE